jgi:ribonuclease J
MDHCGNIGMLRKDVPIVASPQSIVIMKGMQDTASTSLEGDTTYFSPRQPSDNLGLYLSSVAGMNYQGRDFCCTEEPSEALTCFLSRRPGQDGKRAKKLDPGKCCRFDNAAFPFEISAHPVDHSIFGATAYILRVRPPSHIPATSDCMANRSNPPGSSSGRPGRLQY